MSEQTETPVITIEEFLLERVREAERKFEGDRQDRWMALQPLFYMVRAVIDWHKNWPVFVESPPKLETTNTEFMDGMLYKMTQQIQFLTQEEYRKKFGSEPPTAPLLMELAGFFSLHPDFREEWRV